MTPVITGATYKHHKNVGVYRVIGIANDVIPNNPNYPPQVVYQGESNGALWTKPVNDFQEKMILLSEPNEHSP
jgi:hypothetical protein